MLKEVLKCFFQDKYKLFIILGILLFGILFRFLWLDKFPVGMNHDEIDVTLSAKSYWRFGTDISGIPFPKSLFITRTEAALSGFPSILLAPILGLLKSTPTLVRIPFVLVSLLTMFFLSLLAWDFTKNRKLTIIVCLVSLISPWLFFYSRSPTEVPFSLLFTLIGIYLLFRFYGKKIFYSLPFFIAAFLSYFGAKPVVPVLVVFLIFIHAKTIAKTALKTYILYVLLLVGLVGVYIFGSLSTPGSTYLIRHKELSILSPDKYSGAVNEERRASISYPLKTLFFNKFVSLVENVERKYVGSISPNYLFFSGDELVPFQEHGVLYLLDLVFIVLGIISVGKLKNKKEKILAYIILSLFIAGPIGSAITVIGNQYIFRSFLLIPAFILLISLGINFALNNFKFKYGTSIFVIAYLIFFLNFLYFFFFRYSIKQQENHFLRERVLSNYLIRTKSEGEEILFVSKYPIRAMLEYVFFSNYLDRVGELPQKEKGESYEIDGIAFTGDCDAANVISSKTIIIDQRACSIPSRNNYVVIENQKDAGSQFIIYNDKLCKDERLTPWRREHLLSDYSIEKMNDALFCRRWINKYGQ